MSQMCMTIEFLAGTSIEGAAEEAIRKCNMLDMAYINFNFNGINFSVGKWATVKRVSDAFIDAMKYDKKHCVVNGGPRYERNDS